MSPPETTSDCSETAHCATTVHVNLPTQRAQGCLPACLQKIQHTDQYHNLRLRGITHPHVWLHCMLTIWVPHL
jgi:hypothetical protein